MPGSCSDFLVTEIQACDLVSAISDICADFDPEAHDTRKGDHRSLFQVDSSSSEVYRIKFHLQQWQQGNP